MEADIKKFQLLKFFLLLNDFIQFLYNLINNNYLIRKYNFLTYSFFIKFGNSLQNNWNSFTNNLNNWIFNQSISQTTKQNKMNLNKQNKDPKRTNKFSSFQNLKDNKFSIYKYQKNLLIGTKNNFNHLYQNKDDEHDYINAQIIQNQIKKQGTQQLKHRKSLRDEVENLCELWEKLGHQQEQEQNGQKFDCISQQTDLHEIEIQNNKINNKYNESKNHDTVQLTQQQLLACFGQQPSVFQQNGKQSLKLQNKQNEKILCQKCSQNLQKNYSCQQIHQQYDEQLMQIWDDDDKQQKEQKQLHHLDHNSQYNNSIKIISSHLNINFQQNQQFQENQFELEDPNFINQGCMKKNQNKQIIALQNHIQQNVDNNKQIKIISQKHNDTHNVSQNAQKQLLNPKLQQFKDTKDQKHPHQDQKLNQITTNANLSTQLLVIQNSSSNPSIVKQILSQNNHKNMRKLVYGKHFQIYNAKQFALSPYKQNTYSYFGIEFRNKSLLKHQQSIYQQKKSSSENIFYFHSFQTDQAILQLKEEPLEKQYMEFLSIKKAITITAGQKIYKKVMQYHPQICYKIRLCSSQQHIATLFFKIIKDGYLFDLRLYDTYENVHSQPIALIQIKDGYVNQCCYCDTNVFMEKRVNDFNVNNENNRQNQKNKSLCPLESKSIQKLKMILNIKNGKLTANMGINGIQSSPYNCCLQNQNTSKFIYLMGLLQGQILQNSRQTNSCKNNQQGAERSQIKTQKITPNQNKFIIKIGQGVSPLLALVISAAFKSDANYNIQVKQKQDKVLTDIYKLFITKD